MGIKDFVLTAKLEAWKMKNALILLDPNEIISTVTSESIAWLI